MLHATRMTLGLLAQRIGQLTDQIQDREGRLARLVERHAPQLLNVVGIGPDTAVTLLITMEDNPERLSSEASFAALCGVSPVERSSGSRSDASNATLPGRCFTWSGPYSPAPRHRGSCDSG